MKKLFTVLSLLILTNAFAANHEVIIERFAFTPAALEVQVGDTITFTNLDRAPHNVIPRDMSLVQFQASPILRTNDSFTLEITEMDDILAHCGVHPRMPGIEILIAE
jgi:plastocyanin